MSPLLSPSRFRQGCGGSQSVRYCRLIRAHALAVVLAVLAAFQIGTARADEIDVDKIDQDIAPDLKDDPVPELRIQTALRSADGLLADLGLLVSELAGQGGVFKQKVVPNVEIFLFGVDLENPTRFDLIFGSDGEQRLNLMVPVEDKKDFRLDNVEPIGIDMRRKDPKNPDLYELRGDVYEGTLEFKSGNSSEGKRLTYGIFSFKDFPADGSISIEDLISGNERLFFEDFDAALLVDETSGPIEGRDRLVAKLQEKALSELAIRPDETKEAFNLRKLLIEQRFERLSVILSGAKRLAAGATTDEDEKLGRSKLIIEPEEGTLLDEVIQAVGQSPAKFANVPTVEDPVASVRVAVPMHDSRRARIGKMLDTARPVTLARVDDADATDDQKDARRKLIGQAYDQLAGGLEQELISCFYEVHKADEGHRFSIGATTVDGENIKAILEMIPLAFAGATLTLDAAKAGDLALHKVTIPDLAETLRDHLGGETDFYVGFTDDALYVAGGPGGVDLLTTSLDGLEPEPTDTAMSIRLHAGPMAQLIDAVMSNRGFTFIEFFQEGREERLESREQDDDVRRLEVGDPTQWRRAALDVLLKLNDSDDDLIISEFKKLDGDLVGETTMGPAILGAIGELIAQFADENL